MGHDVVLGTRDPNKLDEAKGWAGSLSDWLTAVGNKATVATFTAAAAQVSDIIQLINSCTYYLITISLINLKSTIKLSQS